MAPSSTPNWDDGHGTGLLGDRNLETKTLPGQTVQYCYGDGRGELDLDDEGNIRDNKQKLRRRAKVLAEAAADLGI